MKTLQTLHLTRIDNFTENFFFFKGQRNIFQKTKNNHPGLIRRKQFIYFKLSKPFNNKNKGTVVIIRFKYIKY